MLCFIKNTAKAMGKRLGLRTVVSLGKAGVELGGQGGCSYSVY